MALVRMNYWLNTVLMYWYHLRHQHQVMKLIQMIQNQSRTHTFALSRNLDWPPLSARLHCLEKLTHLHLKNSQPWKSATNSLVNNLKIFASHATT